MRTLFLLVVAAVLVAGCTSSAPAQQAYITVTFDDGYASQYPAAEMLEKHGMRGVFFIPSNRLNGTIEGYPTMTAVEVRDLVRRGHRLGGHTFNNTNLSTVSRQEAETSIRRNKQALAALGDDPEAFAYPFGEGTEYNSTVAEVYRYGRGIRWGINDVPPQDPSRLKTISLTQGNYRDLSGYLDRLDPGEWLIVAIHRVENGTVERTNVDINREAYEWIIDRIAAANATVTTFEGIPDGAP